jgi:CheY-like chemotaxis protein
MTTDTLSILVVDDNAETRETIALCLRTLGYAVTSAADGREAIAEIHARSFDLVITDVLMPEVDGTEVIVAARRCQPNARIIAMSGGGDYFCAEDLLKVGRLLGAGMQLQKPFSRDQLLDSIERLCGNRQVLAGAA